MTSNSRIYGEARKHIYIRLNSCRSYYGKKCCSDNDNHVEASSSDID